MLTLKIMSDMNGADNESNKSYRIIGGIKEITFRRIRATPYERQVLGLKYLFGVLGTKGQVQEWSVCEAECSFPDTSSRSTYLLTGKCFVLNDEGQTVDTYWPTNKIVDVK